MTDNDHPITPPLELVQQWFLSAKAMPVDQWVTDVATQAARWGYAQRGAINETELQKARDEELEACCALADERLQDGTSLRAARRPKPPSQVEEALEALNEAVYMADDMPPEGISTDQSATIRAALERLRELEDLFLSLEQLRDKWNAQSDAFNTWDELGIDEIVWWAQRQALARWGNHPGSPDSSTLQPVPITERLPEPEDCDGEGNVWAWRRFDPEGGMDNGDFWCLASCEWLGDEDSGFTHWLPAHALPVPS